MLLSELSSGSPSRGYCFRYCMDGTVIRDPCWSAHTEWHICFQLPTP